MMKNYAARIETFNNRLRIKRQRGCRNLMFGFLLLSLNANANKIFDFNATCQLAYQSIIELKLQPGQALLDSEKKEHPDNLVPYFLENYIDFFILFFNEDPAEYAARKNNLDKRLQLMDKGPRGSPFYLFTQSVIHFQWAAVKIKFGYSWDAAWEFRRSFLQVKENMEQCPSFAPNSMLYGSMQVAASTIPDGYHWLSNLLGIKGTIRSGMQLMDSFLGKDDPWARLFHNEGIFYYLYLKFYIENERSQVFAYINNNKLDTRNNLLFAYLTTNLAVNDQQSAFAAKVLKEKNNDPAYFDTPVWDLEQGYVSLNHLDADANIYLERFLKHFKGTFYVKDVWQKLSWFYFLQGDQQKAIACRKMVVAKGSTDTEADKQALKEARTSKWPDPLLLKARLLNDGGYHSEALLLFIGKTTSDFTTVEDRLEFAYRLARIYDGLGRKDEAIAAYLTTIKTGAERKEYYAARAALQAGYIYESRGERETAIAFFQKCLNLKDHDYKNSLDQRAKAGIERCKSK